MPDIGVFHPQIVHFVIALLGLGVVLRVISFLPLPGRFAFISPAATLLLVLGALATVPAAKSGEDAHGIPERIPGARDAIVNHEEWGERTRNLFLIIATIEIVALVATRKPEHRKVGKLVLAGSAILGLLGLFFLYETGEHGGEIVYEYAGGVGTRSGDPEDVENLLVAGLYHQAMQDREAGRKEDAARLIDEMARRRPDDMNVRLALIESQIKDRGDWLTAVNLLNAMTGADERIAARAGLLRVEAFETAGMADSAQAALAWLKGRFPENQRVQSRQLEVKAAPPTSPNPVPMPLPAPTTTGR